MPLDDFLNDRGGRVKEMKAKCPKCKRQFKQTSIPIIHNLLASVQFNCVYEGCIVEGFEVLEGCWETVELLDSETRLRLEAELRSIPQACSELPVPQN